MFFGVSVYAVGQTLVFDILPGVPVVDPYIYIYIYIYHMYIERDFITVE
jgi:hypothetical protein